MGWRDELAALPLRTVLSPPSWFGMAGWGAFAADELVRERERGAGQRAG